MSIERRPSPPSPPSDLSFDAVVLPHLDAAYRLAHWLVRNQYDAEDIVQDACLRALRYFRTFSGGDARAWFLKIVRNTCFTWYGRQAGARSDPFDERQHSGTQRLPDPETLLAHADDAALIESALSGLPARFRELLVLRELEGLSYQELADVLDVPIGTVMSGLSRARQAFRRNLDVQMKARTDAHGARPATRQPVDAARLDAPATATRLNPSLARIGK
jgi:RNA polymerase sigma-70 factor, ECF subfamily